jgi:hypothetical protein
VEQLLLDLASKESFFAVLFVALLIYQIVDSRKREEKLMGFFDDITEKFGTLSSQYERLAEDVDEIRQDMKDIFRK